MAKAVLSVVMGKLESMAGERAGQEFRLLLGVQKEAEKLRDTFQFIEAVLQDAEVKQVHQAGVKVWMQKLKHVMYDAEDVLDDWFAGASIPRSALTHGTGNGIMNKGLLLQGGHVMGWGAMVGQRRWPAAILSVMFGGIFTTRHKVLTLCLLIGPGQENHTSSVTLSVFRNWLHHQHGSHYSSWQ